MGRYVSRPLYQYIFMDRHGDIPTFEQPLLQWQYGHNELKSPSGKWLAKIRSKKQLVVFGDHRKAVEVNRASQCACGACRIRIKAWIDDRFLMYSTEEGGTFLFAPEAGETCYLFNDETVQYYGWPER